MGIVLVLVAARRREQAASARPAVGPIEVDFTIPFGGASLQGQPLLETGKPSAGAVIFLSGIDNSHLRLYADVWGRLFQSEPIETDFTRRQQLVVSDSALFPKDNPEVLALSQAEVSHLRSELHIELNGRTAIREHWDAYETTPAETLVGRANFGSYSAPVFKGTILGVRRLPIPRLMPLAQGRHVLMRVTFPVGRVGVAEPLLSGTAAGETHAFYVTYLSDVRLRFTSWSSDGTPPEISEVTIDPASSHSFEFFAGRPGSGIHSFDMRCTFDGNPLFGGASDLRPFRFPPMITSGINAANVPGVLERFTGPAMEVETPGSTPALAVPARSGPIHMIVSLPPDRMGRSEPLLTTGRTGAGDLIYVSYVDADHIRIALDHWGGSGAKSGLIPIDYKAPHEIWISTPALSGGAKNSTVPVTVMIDGTVALSSPLATYPSTPAEVTVAENNIGGSSEDASFSGTVQFVERTGDEPVPKPGS
jgi:hypothetical protein